MLVKYLVLLFSCFIIEQSVLKLTVVCGGQGVLEIKSRVTV